MPIPTEISEIYNPLNQEVINLHHEWGFYKDLYCKDQETIDLLTKSANGFFAILQEIFLEHLIVSISRITDPAKQNGKDNLTFEQLIFSLNQHDDQNLRKELENYYHSEKYKFEPIRIVRNKYVGHFDLERVTLNFPNKLPNNMTFQMFEESFLVMRTILNSIENKYQGGPTSYKESLLIGDVKDLIRKLQNPREHLSKINR